MFVLQVGSKQSQEYKKIVVNTDDSNLDPSFMRVAMTVSWRVLSIDFPFTLTIFIIKFASSQAEVKFDVIKIATCFEQEAFCKTLKLFELSKSFPRARQQKRWADEKWMRKRATSEDLLLEISTVFSLRLQSVCRLDYKFQTTMHLLTSSTKLISWKISPQFELLQSLMVVCYFSWIIQINVATKLGLYSTIPFPERVPHELVWQS